MGIVLFNIFAKITGWPVQFLCFRTKIFYEDAAVQKRKIKGPAIIVSNHTSVFDYAVYLFVFITRTIRCQMAEVLFGRKGLRLLLRQLGGICVYRRSHDLSCMLKSESILKKGGVVLIFPEGRLPLKNEKTPLPFSYGAAFLAMSANVPIIPVYTNGSYFCKKRAKVIIGTPLDASDYTDESLSEKENLIKVTDAVRQRVIDLEIKLNEKD